MRARWRYLAMLTALAVAFALIPAVASAAPAITQGIKGVVKSSATGLPVPFAEVDVDISAGGHVDYIKAGWDGTYSIQLPADDYDIEAYSSRFDYQVFDPVTVAPGAVVTQDFALDEEETPEQPVYRFFNKQAGVHFYTASDEEFLNVYKNLAGTFQYDGIAYRVPWGAGSNPDYENPNTMPLYRFFNKQTGVHFYTMSEQEKNTVLATLADMYVFEGIAYWVTGDPVGSLPVHRYYVPLRNTHFFTADTNEMNMVASKLSDDYHYEGVGFYIEDWMYVAEQ